MKASPKRLVFLNAHLAVSVPASDGGLGQGALAYLQFPGTRDIPVFQATVGRSGIGTITPYAIIVISLIVGGLIVSVMTALLSVYQVVS